MSWRDKLRPASFRGAGFHILESDTDAGRRVVNHQYPLRDLPYSEDMGRKARAFSVRGVVLGKDYMAARDALLAACEEAGPGELVHPYHGTMQVICEGIKTRESTGQGGACHLDLTFAEAGERRYPAQAVDFSAQASTAAGDLQTTAGEVFRRVYSTAGPAWLAAAAAGDVQAALDLVRVVAAVLPSPFDSGAVAEFLAVLDQAAAALDGVAADGAALAALITGAVDGLAGLAPGGRAEAAVEASLEVSRFGSNIYDETASEYGGDLAEIPPRTELRKVQAANQTAIADLVRTLAASTGVKAALAADFASYDQAAAAWGGVLDRLDALMLTTGDDDQYEALRRLYVASNQAWREQGPGLARTTRYQVGPTVRPALAVAYDLYGDLDRESQVVALNRVRHPSLLPGGETLEVLSA